MRNTEPAISPDAAGHGTAQQPDADRRARRRAGCAQVILGVAVNLYVQVPAAADTLLLTSGTPVTAQVPPTWFASFRYHRQCTCGQPRPRPRRADTKALPADLRACWSLVLRPTRVQIVTFLAHRSSQRDREVLGNHATQSAVLYPRRACVRHAAGGHHSSPEKGNPLRRPPVDGEVLAAGRRAGAVRPAHKTPGSKGWWTGVP